MNFIRSLLFLLIFAAAKNANSQIRGSSGGPPLGKVDKKNRKALAVCMDDADCPGYGEFCHEFNFCAKGCSTNEDCPLDQFCNEDYPNQFCEPCYDQCDLTDPEAIQRFDERFGCCYPDGECSLYPPVPATCSTTTPRLDQETTTWPGSSTSTQMPMVLRGQSLWPTGLEILGRRSPGGRPTYMKKN